MYPINLKFNTQVILKNKQPDKVFNNCAAKANLVEGSLSSSNKSFIAFNGLNRVISKKVYSEVDLIKNEIIKYPKSLGIIGNIPPQWVDKIPYDLRKGLIKDLYKSFNEAINGFRKNHEIETLEKNLSTAMRKARIIKSNESVKMKEILSRAHGSTWVLSGIFNDSFLIKIFHEKEENMLSSCIHGNYAELNFAQYWKKNAGKNNQRVNFYFGDTDAGYMINRFISKDQPKYSGKIVPESIYGLTSFDNGVENNIKNYQVDYGGIYNACENLNHNKTARYIYKKVYNAPENERIKIFNKMLKDKKIRNNSDANIGFSYAINLLPRNEQTENLFLNFYNPNNNLDFELKNAFKVLQETLKQKFLKKSNIK